MSDRRDATERHYETPFEHLDREEHAEKAMLGWALRSLRDLGAAIEDLSGRVNALYSNQQGLAETLYRVEQTQRTISRHLSALQHGQENLRMTLAADIQAAADATGAAAQAAADRVIATLDANNAVVLALQEHDAADDAAIALLQAQIDAGTVTPEAAQAILDKLTETQTALAGIDAAPVEPPVV